MLHDDPIPNFFHAEPFNIGNDWFSSNFDISFILASDFIEKRMLDSFSDGQPFARIKMQGFFKEILNFWSNKIKYFSKGFLFNFAERFYIVLSSLVSDKAYIFRSSQNIKDD